MFTCENRTVPAYNANDALSFDAKGSPVIIMFPAAPVTFILLHWPQTVILFPTLVYTPVPVVAPLEGEVDAKSAATVQVPSS